MGQCFYKVVLVGECFYFVTAHSTENVIPWTLCTVRLVAHWADFLWRVYSPSAGEKKKSVYRFMTFSSGTRLDFPPQGSLVNRGIRLLWSGNASVGPFWVVNISMQVLLLLIGGKSVFHCVGIGQTLMRTGTAVYPRYVYQVQNRAPTKRGKLRIAGKSETREPLLCRS